jgi:hypothetical protein
MNPGLQIPGFKRPEDEEDPLALPREGMPELQADQGNTGGGSAPATPSAVVQLVQPPEQTHTTRWSGPEKSTTTTVMAPGVAEAMAEQKAAEQKAAAAAAREQAERTKIAEEEARHKEREAAIARETEAEKAKLRAARAEQISALVAEDEKAQADVEKNAKITDYWADRGAPAMILSSFLTGLGHYASVKGGGPNMAGDVLRDAMARDRQTKIDRFTMSKEFQALKSRNLNAARSALADAIKGFDDQQNVQINRLMKEGGAIVAKMKIPMAQAEWEKLQAQGEALKAENRAKALQHYDGKITEKEATTGGSHTVNVGGGPDKQGPDLAVLDAEGTVIGQARSPKEALELREKRTALEGGLVTADKLIGEITKNGKLVPLLDADKDAIRKTYISRLLEAKKNITGAINEADVQRAEKQFNTAWNRGPDAVVESISAWKDGLRTDYNASIKSSATALPGSSAPPSGATPAPKRGGGEREKPEVKKLSNGKTAVRVGNQWRIQD